MSYIAIGLGEECQKIGPIELCACGTQGVQALTELLNAFLHLSLLHQCPAAEDTPTCLPVRKSMCRREDDGGVGVLLGSTPLAAELMAERGLAEGKTEAKGVRHLLRQRHR